MPTGQRTQVRARTGTNNRRPRPRAAPRDNHNRLPCPRGSSCPYIDEYQHGLEFSHDRPAVQQPTVEPFSGPAHRLGFADPRFQGLAGLEGMDGFYDGRGLLGLPGFLSGGEDNTFCSVCNSKISRVDLESHIEQHEAAVLAESLRMHQDKELEESMLQDCARLEEQARKKKEEENRLQAEEEQKELQEAIEESKRLAAISDRNKAISALDAEPESTAIGVVAIRFTLPSGSRCTRRFLKTSVVQEIFHYLKTLEELMLKDYGVRFAIGNTEIISNKKENCDKTFEQIGISFNCSLIVVIFDCDETKGFDGPECVLTTKKEVKVIEQSNIKSQRHPSIESSATQSSLGKRDMVEVIEIEDSPVPVKSSKIEIPLQPNGTEIGSSVIDLT